MLLWLLWPTSSMVLQVLLRFLLSDPLLLYQNCLALWSTCLQILSRFLVTSPDSRLTSVFLISPLFYSLPLPCLSHHTASPPVWMYLPSIISLSIFILCTISQNSIFNSKIIFNTWVQKRESVLSCHILPFTFRHGHCTFRWFVSESEAFVFSASLEASKLQLSSLSLSPPSELGLLTWMGSLSFYMGTDILMTM